MKYVKGLFYGIIYGLAGRGIFTLEGNDHPLLPTDGLMTLSFMVLVPFVVGIIVAYHLRKGLKTSRFLVFTNSLAAIFGVVVISVALGQEGIICALMAVPLFAVMSLLGGLTGILIFPRQKDKLLVSFAMFLPFIAIPIEQQFGLAEKRFTEHTTITINAPAGVVWQNITRVRQISEQENNKSLFQFLGFPRPIEAELDTVAPGGVRKAIFARGLFFTETVTEVVPGTMLAFNIKADPASTPPAALDQHVMVGGRYFDVLEGRYEIEQLPGNKVLLHLTSHFRLSTHFNFYSGLWSQLIMRDIQQNILGIIKARCEQGSSH